MTDEQAGRSYRVPVHGHTAAVGLLAAALAAGRAGQAYLLVGPPAVGKRTLARWFAQRLLCLAPEEDGACGRCRACRLVAAGTWPDLHLAAPPLRIEAVRELQHDLALSPAESRQRVAILPEVELASAGAANCLLKTLEEPPRQVVLVLTTAEAEAVLPTVRSRCQVVTLRPLAPAEVEQALVAGWQVPAEEATLLARLAGGRLGWAVRALADETLLTERRDWLDALARTRAAGPAGRLALAAELARPPERVGELLATWGSWWRDVLLVGHGLAEAVVNRDRLAELEAAARQHPPGHALAALQALQTAWRQLAAHTSAQLTLEVLVLELP